MLGHAIAAMTMDLYSHLVDDNLWEAARAAGGILGASEPPESERGKRAPLQHAPDLQRCLMWAVPLFPASAVLARLADLLADGQAPPWLVRVGTRLARHFPAGSRELCRDRRGLLVQEPGRPLFAHHSLAGNRGLCRDRPGLFLQELGRLLVAMLPSTAAKKTHCAAKETHGVIIGRRLADFPIRASRVADELADHTAFVLPLLS